MRLLRVLLAALFLFLPVTECFAQSQTGTGDHDGDGGPDPPFNAPASFFGGPYLGGNSRVLVVRADLAVSGGASGTDGDMEHGRALLNGIFSRLGVYADWISAKGLKTEWCRIGEVPDGRGGVTKYGAVFYWGFSGNANPNAYGVRPDSLRLMRTNAGRGLTWVLKPSLMIGPVGNYFSGAYANGGGVVATDTLGNMAITSACCSDNRLFTTASTDDPTLEWKAWDAYNAWPFGEYASPYDTSGPGTLRNIVSMRRSAFLAALGTGYDNCDYCYGTIANRLPQDSTVFWARYRDPDVRVDAPWGFVVPSANQGFLYSSGLLAGAVAWIDSVCRARGDSLIGAVPGWKPPKLAVQIDGFTQRSTENSLGADYGQAGIGNIADTTLVAARIDSIAALGVKMNPTWNPDSSVAFQYQMRWIRRLPFYKVGLRPTTGCNNSSPNNVLLPSTVPGKFSPYDPFGSVRGFRAWLDAAWPPANSDTTVDALLYFGKQRLDSVWTSGKTQAAVEGYAYDYAPLQYNSRAMWPAADSFATAMNRAGLKVAVIAPDLQSQSQGFHVGVDGGGGRATYTDLSNFTTGETSWPARDPVGGRTLNGVVRFVANRATRDNGSTVVLNPTHNWAEEFLWGFWLKDGPWYLGDMHGYYHNFRTHTSVFTTQLAELGCSHGGSGLPRAAGWVQVKDLVNQVKWINRMAGRTVVEISYLEDL